MTTYFIPASFASEQTAPGSKRSARKRSATSAYSLPEMFAHICICSLYPSVTGLPFQTPPSSEKRPQWMNMPYRSRCHAATRGSAERGISPGMPRTVRSVDGCAEGAWGGADAAAPPAGAAHSSSASAAPAHTPRSPGSRDRLSTDLTGPPLSDIR